MTAHEAPAGRPDDGAAPSWMAEPSPAETEAAVSTALPATGRHEAMIETAEAFARVGFAQIGWAPVSDGKAPKRHWKADATDDPALVVKLLHGARNSLVIPKGRAIIIDIDRPAAWAELAAAGLPPTFTIDTPTPGHGHVYGHVPPDIDMATIPGTFEHGEIRRFDPTTGTASMVLGPWALRPDGVYTPRDGVRVIAALPPSVIDYLIASSRRQGAERSAARGPADTGWTIKTGRHIWLMGKNRNLRGNGLSGEVLVAALLQLDRDRCAPPLAEEVGGEAEIRAIADWADRVIGDDPPPKPADDVDLPGPADPTERPWPRPRSEADPAAALADVWHIDGVARPGRFVVIAAAEGVGKSYVRLEACIRLATGHGALFNHYRIPARCRVLSFDVENGDEEETRREEEVLARLGLTRSDLDDYWGVSLAGLLLTDPADQAYIRDAIERSAPAVVFFDTGTSMVGEEWGKELKVAIRFLRGLARQFGCTVVVLVHLVKPDRTASKSRSSQKTDGQGQHGTRLADVMGQWTRQADTVAMMAPAGADRVIWTVRKRAPHSQLVLHAEAGTFDVIQVVAGEDLGVTTMERIHGCIATGYADAGAIATYLELSERTVFRHIAKLRAAGRVALDAPLRLSAPVSSPVSARPSVDERG